MITVLVYGISDHGIDVPFLAAPCDFIYLFLSSSRDVLLPLLGRSDLASRKSSLPRQEAGG